MWLHSVEASVRRRDAPLRLRDAACMAAVRARGARGRGGQPGREEALRRSSLQLQQTCAAGGQYLRRAEGLHQAEAQPAHRRGKRVALASPLGVFVRFGPCQNGIRV